jgi:hypothetical protein
MTISLSLGNSRSMFFRLCVRAPRIRIVSMDFLQKVWRRADETVYPILPVPG